MNFIIENLAVIIALVCVIACVVTIAYKFFKKSTESQIASLKEWLLYAVTIAEKELGSGTGKLKLRSVYDMFLVKFPWLAKIISFDTFSAYVDEALIQMKELLATNTRVVSFVNGPANN